MSSKGKYNLAFKNPRGEKKKTTTTSTTRRMREKYTVSDHNYHCTFREASEREREENSPMYFPNLLRGCVSARNVH